VFDQSRRYKTCLADLGSERHFGEIGRLDSEIAVDVDLLTRYSAKSADDDDDVKIATSVGCIS